MANSTTNPPMLYLPQVQKPDKVHSWMAPPPRLLPHSVRIHPTSMPFLSQSQWNGTAFISLPPPWLYQDLRGNASTPPQTLFQTWPPSQLPWNPHIWLATGPSDPNPAWSLPHLPELHHTIYHAQNKLGWVQLYYSHLLTLWVTVQNNQHPTINGLHYYVQALTLIWKAVLQIWQLCNHQLQPQNHHQEDKTQLHAIIHQLIHDAQHDTLLWDTVDQIGPNFILARPTHQIWQWINNSISHIRTQCKAAKLRAKLHTHDIRKYFKHKMTPQPPTTANKNLLQLP